MALIIHVDDMVMTGEDRELEKIEAFLQKLSFFKRRIEIVDGVTKVRVNEKYI